MFRKLSSRLRKSSTDGPSDSGNPDPADSRPAARANTVNRVALYRLLLSSFAETEVMDLAQRLNVDYSQLPSQSYNGKTRELIMHFERRGRLSELLAACAHKRPDVDWGSVISVAEDKAEDLVLPQVGPLKSASAHQPARPSQAETAVLDAANSRLDLYRLMSDQLSNSEFAQICFDAGVDHEDLPGRNLTDRVRELLTYLGHREQLDQLIAAGMIHRPDLDWLEASGIEVNRAELPEAHHDGYKTAAIRSMLLSCFETYEELDDFCQKYFPHFRHSLTITLSIEDNVQQLLGYCIRKSTTDDLLTAILELYPGQFDQFGPYTVN